MKLPEDKTFLWLLFVMLYCICIVLPRVNPVEELYVIFDEETGLVYVPKKYLKTDESGNAIYASVRIQLLYQMPKSGDEFKTHIQITIHKGEAKGEIAESGLIEAGFYDGKTSFQLAKEKGAKAECGTVVWSDDIDIAPEHLYEYSQSMEDS